MITSLLSLLTAAGLSGPNLATGSTLPKGASGAPAPAFHAIAFVTDPMSHGSVGDGFLSLNEAIQLHNGTLSVNQLSVAEQIQVSLLPGTGSSSFVTWIEIDSEFTPTITIEQDLDTIVNTPYGLFIRGSGGPAELDFSGPGITRGIYATTNNLILQGLHVVDAPYGLDVVQTDVTGQPGCTLENCRFENNAQFGVRVTGTQAGGVGRLILEDTAFVNNPNAVVVDESPADRVTIFEAHDVDISGANIGFDLEIGTGGSSRFTFERTIVDCTTVGIDLQAPASSGRPNLIEGNHLRVRAPTCARFDCAADAVTWMQCAMWNLLAPTGGVALELGSVGDQVYGELKEFRTSGDVTIGTGNAPIALDVRNMRAVDGAVTVSTTPAQTFAIRESRFTNCTTETVGTGSIQIDDSCFVGGVLGGSSATGTLQVTGSFVANAGGGVSASQSLAQAQLGSMHATPDDPLLGGAITFGADLPAGVVCAFALGEVADVVPLLPAPLYVYVDPLAYVMLPGVYTGQQSTSWTAPSQLFLRGYDLVVQPVVLALSGPAPALQLPPGWRFVLR